jgi:hypothetical protein
MPAASPRNQGKTLFVKETLIDRPTANPKSVNEAWKAAGMEGTISETLVNKMRAQLKLTGNLRGTRPGQKKKSTSPKHASTSKKRGRNSRSAKVARSEGASGAAHSPAASRSIRFSDLEAELDRLLFSVMSLGNLPEVEKALRQTRRALYSAFATKG